MKQYSVVGAIIIILNAIVTSSAIRCFSCDAQWEDEFCHTAVLDECPPDYICYSVILRSIGEDKGCTMESDYCKRNIDRIGPIIRYCDTCNTDGCNGDGSRSKLFSPLLVFGVVIIICVS